LGIGIGLVILHAASYISPMGDILIKKPIP